MMGQNRLTKINPLPPPQKKKTHTHTHQANLSRNYATLQFVIHFNEFFLTLQYCDGVHEVDKINISPFFQKASFKGKWVICVQFGPKLKHLVSHHLPYSKTFIIMGYDRQAIVVLVNFQAKGEFKPNLVQNHSTLYLMICHKVFKF